GFEEAAPTSLMRNTSVLKYRRNHIGCHQVQLAFSTFRADIACGNARTISPMTGIASSNPPATISPPYSDDPENIAIESEIANPTDTKMTSSTLERRSRTSKPPCLARSMIPEPMVALYRPSLNAWSTP